ncbi:MAG: hypothetical protein RIC52_09120 [Amphiplicatus sp.]
MSTTVLHRAGPYYDVVPVNPRYANAGSGRMLNVIRKFGQGAGAAYLAFAGSSTMISPAQAGQAPPVIDFTSLNGIAESLATGGLNGPLQVIGALALFLAAGPCIARFIGLALFACAIFLYTQGVSIEDMGLFVGHLLERLSAAGEAFASAPGA